jgi:hypothetical protein
VKQLIFLCLAAGLLPVYGEEHRQAPSVAAPIFLYTQFQQQVPVSVEDAVHEELETIMDPIGMRFEWRSLSRPRGNEVSIELAVVTFKGRCDVSNLMSTRINPGALGWTHVSDGVILPFSDVDCDRIRGFVQRDLLSIAPEKREQAFGHALARVLAHELYHIFANTAKHGSCGVGKAAYTTQELLSDEFTFEERESDALRSGKAHSALESAGTM